jgi:hypothetical protein
MVLEAHFVLLELKLATGPLVHFLRAYNLYQDPSFYETENTACLRKIHFTVSYSVESLERKRSF